MYQQNKRIVKVSSQEKSNTTVSIRTSARAPKSSGKMCLRKLPEFVCPLCDPLSPARRGKRYLLIYRRSDRAYASMFHAKAARLGARAQRQSMPRLGHINAGSRRANAESPKYRATPPQVSKKTAEYEVSYLLIYIV